MRREDKDQLQQRASEKDPLQYLLHLTDWNKACAEFPKMKEKPRIIVAHGTSDDNVSLRLKIKRQMKMTATRTTASSTASSLATIEPASWNEVVWKFANDIQIHRPSD